MPSRRKRREDIMNQHAPSRRKRREGTMGHSVPIMGHQGALAAPCMDQHAPSRQNDGDVDSVIAGGRRFFSQQLGRISEFPRILVLLFSSCLQTIPAVFMEIQERETM